jgi:hypothetical protein
MRIEKVPIDMSSEQKEILGIVSKRHLIYIVVGGVLLYTYVPFIVKLLLPIGWLFAALSGLLAAAPVVVIVLFLGFKRMDKYHLNLDYYLYIKFQRKTQYGNWRKGR